MTIGFSSSRTVRSRRPAAQRGAVLFMALIVLTVMLLVGVGLMRKTNTGASVAGNLAFKQNATSVGDLGVETARDWVRNNTALLNDNHPELGYFATWGNTVDPATFWAVPTSSSVTGGAGTPNVREVSTVDSSNPNGEGTGNAVSYVIHRMCQSTGSQEAVTQSCVVETDATGNGGRGGMDNIDGGNAVASGFVHYRVTARVVGPRNTMSYVQVIFH